MNQLRFSGSGGQGVITAAIIFAEAAIVEGKNAVQSQSYGPEARGGASKAEVARELAYRLYTLCERKKRATEALSYNGLVQSWPEITRLASEGGAPKNATAQSELFDGGEE